MKTGVDTSNELERALVSLKSLLDAFQYIFSQKYSNFGLSSLQTIAPEGSSATKRFKEILLGSSKKTSFLKEPPCSCFKEILLGSISPLRSTQLQNEDANQERHEDEEDEDNRGLKVVMFDEASTLMVLVRLKCTSKPWWNRWHSQTKKAVSAAFSV